MKTPGRPTIYGRRMRAYRIRLAKQHAAALEAEGAGNLSRGTRKMAEKSEHYKGEKK